LGDSNLFKEAGYCTRGACTGGTEEEHEEVGIVGEQEKEDEEG
jgi:hypothetical protein